MQSRYLFRRTTNQVVQLSGSPGGGFGTSDNGVYKHLLFTIDDAGLNTSAMKDMYHQYRINAVGMKMFFSTTNSDAGMINTASNDAHSQEYSNAQVLVYTMPNRTGRSNAPTEIEFLNTQAHKCRTALNGGRPLKTYMRVNQLDTVYNGAVQSDYTLVRPHLLGTNESTTPHYGLTIMFKRADGQAFTSEFSNKQFVNIQWTYYLEFRGVK